jgi:hypothetical protein
VRPPPASKTFSPRAASYLPHTVTELASDRQAALREDKARGTGKLVKVKRDDDRVALFTFPLFAF